MLPNDCVEKTEVEILTLIPQDQENYYCLMKLYEEKLLRYIQRISSFSSDDAEDVLQDVFMKAFLNLRSFDADMKFSSWIYRIAHNETVSAHRKKSARPRVVHGIDDEAMVNLFASDEDIEEAVDLRFEATHVHDAIHRLDKKYSEVLILRYLD